MKKHLLLAAALLLPLAWCPAQTPSGDVIYFANGTIRQGRIETADADKFGTVLDNGGRYNALRDKFLLFFSKSGKYLVAKAIESDVARAQAQIGELYAERTDTVAYHDILVRAVPREVIPCTIRNVLENAVNYLTLDGKSGSVNKDNLLAMIRSDGSHELPGNLDDTANILSALSAEVRQARMARKTAPEPPKPEPAPTPTKPLSLAELKPAAQTAEPAREQKRLTPDEQRLYKAKSVEKMQELTNALNEIVDPRRSRAEKNLAISKARRMFIDDARVEVSAINSPGNKTSRSIGEYLDRLSRLNFTRVSITYAEIAFVEEFAPDDQGNYWGLASYVQNFNTNTFNDLTEKRQRIKLQPYTKVVNGANQEKFEVMLGNISINVE